MNKMLTTIFICLFFLFVSIATPSVVPDSVRIIGTPPAYFSSLQAAYDAAIHGDIIQSRALVYSETFYVDTLDNKSVTIEGGYNYDFTEIIGMTSLFGNMIINSGTTTLKNIILLGDNPPIISELMGLIGENGWNLRQINTSTGTTTLINSSPIPMDAVIGEGTAIDITNGVLYVIGEDLNWVDCIYVIDLATGTLLRTLYIDPPNNTRAIETIFFNSNDELMGLIKENGNWNLRQINTSTGTTTLINSSPIPMDNNIGDGTDIDITNGLLYVTSEDLNWVDCIYVIDLATGTLLRTLYIDSLNNTPGYIDTIFFNSNDELMGLIKENGNWNLRQINTSTGTTTLINSSPIPMDAVYGEGTAIDITNGVVYVIGADLNWVDCIYVIDLATGTLLRTLYIDSLNNTPGYIETIFFNSNALH